MGASPRPATFRRIEAGRAVLVVDPAFENAARALGALEPGGFERLVAQGGGSEGRSSTTLLELPRGEGRVLLRSLRHGGLFGPVLGGAFLGMARPLREIEITAQLRGRGAPVPRPLWVMARRRVGPIHAAAVATLFEKESVDALHFLQGMPEPQRMRRAAAACGRSIRSFHDAGGHHPDLHIKNLLVRERRDEIECILVDLDKARAGNPPSPQARMTELMRLYRSLVKRRVAEAVGVRGCACFLDAYVAGDRSLRSALLARLPRERRRVAIHAMGYRR